MDENVSEEERRVNRTPESHPQQRKADQGWRRFVRDNWYRDVWLVIISVCCLGAILVQSHKNRVQDSKNKVVQKNSHDSCVRSKVFAPALENAYKKYKILDDKQLKKYDETIPKTCP